MPPRSTLRIYLEPNTANREMQNQDIQVPIIMEHLYTSSINPAIQTTLDYITTQEELRIRIKYLKKKRQVKFCKSMCAIELTSRISNCLVLVFPTSA